MLGFFRRQAQSTYLQVTIIIIILVFIFWGVGNNQGNSPNTVATVNGESISYQDYQKEYDQTYNTLRDQFGGTVPKALLDTFNIKKQVLNKLIQGALLRQGALKSKLYVSNQELRNTIQNMDAFKNNGVFDSKWYDQVLAGSRLTAAKFEEGMRYDLLSAKVMDHLSRFAQVSPAMLKDLFNFNYSPKKFDYVIVKAESFKDKVEVTDEKLAAFFEKNKTNYQSDPTAKISYLLFSFDGTGSEPPSDETVTQYYKNNIAQFTSPERRKARHILIRSKDSDSADLQKAAKAKIEEVQTKLKAGEDFAELAKQYSEDGTAARGGDLGFFSRGQMVKPFENAAFNLQEGEISSIVKTSFGLHLLQLDKIEPAHTRSLDEVKKGIVANLSRESNKSDAFKKANNAYEQIILSGSMKKYATEKDDALSHTDFFSQQSPPAELKSLPHLVNTAFSLNKGELSSITETTNGYAIIYVDDSKPPTQLSLAEMKDQVSQDFIGQESATMAKETANSLLTKIKEGGKIGDQAKALGVESQSTPYFSRADSSAAKLPNQLAVEALKLSATNPTQDEVFSEDGSFYVISFNDSKTPEDKLFEQKKAELEKELASTRNNDILTAWIKYLQSEAEITTNEQLL